MAKGRFWRLVSKRQIALGKPGVICLAQVAKAELDLALVSVIAKPKKIEPIRVFQALSREVGIVGGKGPGEVCGHLASAFQTALSDVSGEGTARPPWSMATCA